MCGKSGVLRHDNQIISGNHGLINAEQTQGSSTERKCGGRCANCKMSKTSMFSGDKHQGGTMAKGL